MVFSYVIFLSLFRRLGRYRKLFWIVSLFSGIGFVFKEFLRFFGGIARCSFHRKYRLRLYYYYNYFLNYFIFRLGLDRYLVVNSRLGIGSSVGGDKFSVVLCRNFVVFFGRILCRCWILCWCLWLFNYFNFIMILIYRSLGLLREICWALLKFIVLVILVFNWIFRGLWWCRSFLVLGNLEYCYFLALFLNHRRKICGKIGVSILLLICRCSGFRSLFLCRLGEAIRGFF